MVPRAGPPGPRTSLAGRSPEPSVLCAPPTSSPSLCFPGRAGPGPRRGLSLPPPAPLFSCIPSTALAHLTLSAAVPRNRGASVRGAAPAACSPLQNHSCSMLPWPPGEDRGVCVCACMGVCMCTLVCVCVRVCLIFMVTFTYVTLNVLTVRSSAHHAQSPCGGAVPAAHPSPGLASSCETEAVGPQLPATAFCFLPV